MIVLKFLIASYILGKKKKHISSTRRAGIINRLRGDSGQKLSLDELKEGITGGDRYALSKAITLIEKSGSDYDPLAIDLLDWSILQESNSYRIAVTGSPGVGKSTFIELLGQKILAKELSMAILAIDPSSKLSRGSILGDKTRMEELAKHEEVFIRPSPAGNSLGGVTRQTRNTISLCEAAGYDVIIVETVGVGQSETLVHSMVDLFLLLLQPGEGDELQGIKKGIVELSDILIVNKADGNNIELAKRTKSDYRNALHYAGKHQKDWKPQLFLASALDGTGFDEIWKTVETFFQHLQQGDRQKNLRMQQNKYWFEEEFRSMLVNGLFQMEWFKISRMEYLEKIKNGNISSYKASRNFVTEILKQVSKYE